MQFDFSPMIRLATTVLLILTAVVGAVDSATAQDPQLRFGSHVPPDVEIIYERGLSWLAEQQKDSGNFGDQAASHGYGSGGDGDGDVHRDERRPGHRRRGHRRLHADVLADRRGQLADHHGSREPIRDL